MNKKTAISTILVFLLVAFLMLVGCSDSKRTKKQIANARNTEILYLENNINKILLKNEEKTVNDVIWALARYSNPTDETYEEGIQEVKQLIIWEAQLDSLKQQNK